MKQDSKDNCIAGGNDRSNVMFSVLSVFLVIRSGENSYLVEYDIHSKYKSQLDGYISFVGANRSFLIMLESFKYRIKVNAPLRKLYHIYTYNI